MITATTWVPRGYSAPFPKKYVFDEEEYERISKLAKLELDDAKSDLAEAQSVANGAAPAAAKETRAEDPETNDEDQDADGDVWGSLHDSSEDNTC